ncbi:MAG: cupin domain-containing protein [Moorea sp. SIOASIH]|uniref:cupin domain-containing protein n=1 Tax=Moorena sp. SIOASIH TaxID=2607817 RepID=UPI0013B5FA69|nr:cupin domain-containing protein [Moorena sp. SIOASIH]NEO38699.1 cupin domain-containing protein [Moorena sp. SIOASIH]
MAQETTLSSNEQVALPQLIGQGPGLQLPSCDGQQCLAPNMAYKVDRTPKNINKNYLESGCYGQVANVKFHFEGSQFEDSVFEEIYPIQDGWDLFFNTPSEFTKGYFQDMSGCGLIPRKSRLELLSGFKAQDEVSDDPKENIAHFVVAKDYYYLSPDSHEYKYLGSLTAISGQNFPALGGAAVGQLIIAPGGIRAPHWHLNSAEAGYCYEGIGQVGTIVPGKSIPTGENGTFFESKRIEEAFVRPGELFLFPEGSQHYLRNVGAEGNFSCVLFFSEDPSLNPDQLLTITLSNIVGNTPAEVLGPILVTDKPNNPSTKTYSAATVSQAPPQVYSFKGQGPDVVPVIEACKGEEPNPENPGCPSATIRAMGKTLNRSKYSFLEP